MKEDVLVEDFQFISDSDFFNWEELRGKTILITGGTGLIGSILIKALCFCNTKRNLGIQILALVRNIDKAKQVLGLENEILHFIPGSVENLPTIHQTIDYIIHGASPTASQFFSEYPVETIQIAVRGTTNLLELAKIKKIKGFLYLSSMEVYGAPKSDDLIKETEGCILDSMTVRSCYPIAKRLCETLCACMFQEYAVPTKVIRLSQTFGPGVLKNDNRIFAEFARNAIMGEDILLKTLGNSKRSYLYTADAVTAILTILINGNAGEAYNACNMNTYCNIKEMAELVANEVSHYNIRVLFSQNISDNSLKYPPTHNIHLDTSKLEGLGWKPTRDLKEMYLRMISEMS